MPLSSRFGRRRGAFDDARALKPLGSKDYRPDTAKDIYCDRYMHAGHMRAAYSRRRAPSCTRVRTLQLYNMMTLIPIARHTEMSAREAQLASSRRREAPRNHDRSHRGASAAMTPDLQFCLWSSDARDAAAHLKPMWQKNDCHARLCRDAKGGMNVLGPCTSHER